MGGTLRKAEYKEDSMGWEAALGAIGGWAVLCVQSGVLGASMVLCTTPFYRLGQGRFALLSVRMYPRLHVSQKYVLYISIFYIDIYYIHNSIIHYISVIYRITQAV